MARGRLLALGLGGLGLVTVPSGVSAAAFGAGALATGEPEGDVATEDAAGEDDEAEVDGDEPSDATDATQVDAQVDRDEGEPTAADADATAPTTDDDPDETTTPPPTHDVPADEPDFSTGLGGYYGSAEILERPPPDGQREIIVGSILFPLGTLATITSAVGTWMTVPAHCTQRLAALGITIDDPEQCRGVFAFNVVRVTYGSLMMASGATILAIGLIRRDRYRKWRNDHGMRAQLRPVLGLLRLRPGARGASVGMQLRF